MKAIVFAVLLFAAAPFAAGQTPAPDRERTAGRLQLRYQIGVMERVLEQAVQHGAQMMGRGIQTVAPDLLMFSGPARARGFKLEGYGFFFDVEVPALRRSVAWSFRTLNMAEGGGTSSALKALKQHVQSMPSGAARDSLEQALQRIELQVGLTAPAPAPRSPLFADEPGVAAASTETAAGKPDPLGGDNPDDSYTTEVKAALIDAMLDHSGPIAIGPDEWLTVAARADEVGLAPSDMYEAQTLVLRIRGTELAAFRADRLTRDEARLRVEVNQF